MIAVIPGSNVSETMGEGGLSKPIRFGRSMKERSDCVSYSGLVVPCFPGLSRSLLFDAAKVDLPDQCFGDDVEGVDLLLH